MKLGSTRFWVSASAALFLTSAAASAQNAPPQVQRDSRGLPARNHEWKLAGLLPGHTTLKRAELIMGTRPQDLESGSAVWRRCDGSELAVEANTQGVIQTVRASKAESDGKVSECFDKARPSAVRWTTSHGLQLGDPGSRVIQLYGNPDSRSPSTKGGQPLQLLYYAFDWAGPDVPQVMQVVCTPEKDGQPGRVVEITLAASSL